MNKSTMLLAGLLAAGMALPALAGKRDDDDRDGWRRGGMHHGMGQCRHHGGKHGRMHGKRHGGRMWWGEPLKHIDGRLAFIKAELKLTDAQNAAWDEFAGMLRTSVESRAAMHKQRMEDRNEMDDDDAKMSLPERLAKRQERAEMRMERIKTMREGFDKFYGVLDDKQKETADELVPMMMRLGMGRRGMGRGGKRGGGMMHHGGGMGGPGMGKRGSMGPGGGMGPGGMAPGGEPNQEAPEPPKDN